MLTVHRCNTDTDTAGKTPEITAATGNTIDKYLDPNGFQPYQDEKGKVIYPSAVGSVAIKDTAEFRRFLDEYKGFFPGDAVFAYGIRSKR